MEEGRAQQAKVLNYDIVQETVQTENRWPTYALLVEPPPSAIDLKKDRGLTVQWADGASSYYTIAYLRRMSPSADARELRDQQKKNPLAILPSSMVSGLKIEATGAELVGNYAIRVSFNDGHDTGIYSWQYLREIDPAMGAERVLAEGSGGGAGVTGGVGVTGKIGNTGGGAAASKETGSDKGGG